MKPVITFLIMSLASFLFIFNPMTASNVASMCSVHPKHLSKRWEWCLLLGMGWRIPLQVHFSIAFLKTTPWNKTSFRRVLPSCSVSVSSRHNTPGSLPKTESWKSSEGWRFHRVSSPTHLSLLLGTHLVYLILLVKTNSGRQRACDRQDRCMSFVCCLSKTVE